MLLVFCSGQSQLLSPHLVVHQQLQRVVPPLNEDQLVGLSRGGVGEGCPYALVLVRPHPKTQGKREDLLQQRPLHLPVHVVGSYGETELEGVRSPGAFLAGSCVQERTTFLIQSIIIYFILFSLNH